MRTLELLPTCGHTNVANFIDVPGDFEHDQEREILFRQASESLKIEKILLQNKYL
jgi:hypothetical protein